MVLTPTEVVDVVRQLSEHQLTRSPHAKKLSFVPMAAKKVTVAIAVAHESIGTASHRAAKDFRPLAGVAVYHDGIEDDDE